MYKVPCGKEDDCIDRRNINHFSGVLPKHHNEPACHNLSQERRQLFCQMKCVLKELENCPPCDEWDTPITKGPFKIGEYNQRKGKPWDLGRVKSKELVGGRFYPACLCFRKNGLQDDCPMTKCHGKPWCLTEPLPDCPPFTGVAKEWIEEDPLKDCPNYMPGETQ